MAGYYTQKRLQPLWLYQESTQFGSQTPTLQSSSYNHMQETTSYRSSPGEGSTQSAAQLLRSNQFGAQSSLDNGHEFSTVGCKVYGVNQKFYTYKSEGRTVIANPQLRSFADATILGNTKLPIPNWEVTERNAQGNKAIQRTQPTSSGADFATFLGEFMREGLPSVVFASFLPALKSKSDLLRRSGNEYLNAQFGWAPLIAELTKLLRVVSSSYTMLEQYKRDSGKVVRRSFAFPIERFVTSSTVKGNSNAFIFPWYYTGGAVIADTTISTEVTDKIYFRGAYSYYIPTDPGLLGEAERFASYADYLLGIKLTPEILWNLAPWTWLSDWFVNIGDNLSVASRFEKDGLVLRYGYLMRHYKVKQVHTSSNHLNATTGNFGFPQMRQTIVRESKRRIRAEPYGFGFNTDALTSVQWAILGALGLSDRESSADYRRWTNKFPVFLGKK